MTKIKDLGCTALTVLFISIPIWVMSVAWRGPVFAFLALVVLLALVFGVAALNRLFSRNESKGSK
jgi:hypothetical protein